jgi:hypothetical protein
MQSSKRFAIIHSQPLGSKSILALQEIRKQFTLISELRSEIKSLQGDNLKLYEKVRYMQSYREEGSGSSRSQNANPFESMGEEMGKYKARYEERMNPFTAFQSQVRFDLPSSVVIISKANVACVGGNTCSAGTQPP